MIGRHKECLVSLLILASAIPVSAESPAIITVRNLDAENCRSYRGTEGRAPTADELAVLFGGPLRQPPAWRAGKPETDNGDTFHYRIAFATPTLVGTVFVPRAVELRVLKTDAPYPGDPAIAEHWTVIEVPTNHAGGRLFTLPVGTKTRGLLISEKVRRKEDESSLRDVRIFRDRLHSVTPQAFAYADREYTPPEMSYCPTPASNIPKGIGGWVNVGKDGRGYVPAAAVSDINPSWFSLCWRDPQTVTRIWLHSNAEKYEIEAYAGPAAVHPLAGTAEEWRKLKNFTETASPYGGRWLDLSAPVATRGLRVTFLKTSSGAVAKVDGFHAVSDLGEAAAPPPPVAADEPAPWKVAFKLEEDRNVTIAVNGPDGRRAKNLIARVPLKTGNQSIGWDLKDEEGRFVSPGNYTWTALTWPDIQHRYETTVYPNTLRHAPDNSPWFNGDAGSGGWLADHTQPTSACVLGDRVFLGAPGAESGVSLIECNLDGQKKWGHHSFAGAMTGPKYLAADGKTIYVAAPEGDEFVWTVDADSKQVKQLLRLKAAGGQLRGMSGLAAHDGNLYLSVRSAATWLANAASADDADLDACSPILPQRRGKRFKEDIPPDPRNDYLRFFRLTGTPPGGAAEGVSPFLETQSSSRPKQHLVLAFRRPISLGSVVHPACPDKDVRVTLSVLKDGAAFPPNPEKDADWLPVPAGKTAWDVAVMPPNTMAKALRITFARGAAAEDDPLARVLDEPKGRDDFLDPTKKPDDLLGNKAGMWKGRLEGMKLLRRRFANVASEATIRVSSGKVAADGSWDAKRTTPLTETDPGVFLMEWKKPQPLRGLAIKEIDGAVTKIDVFTGPADAAIDLNSATGWETVSEYHQQRRNWYHPSDDRNLTARYMDGYVDFGREIKTRAARLRVVKQWLDVGGLGADGVRVDQGGQNIEPARCRIYGVAALTYLGGEPKVDSSLTERIEAYANGKLVRNIPIEQPGQLATAPAGDLYAISGARVVRVDTKGDDHKPVVTDLQKPTAIACDRHGNIYVFDNGSERKNVRVYDAAGKLLRTIGDAGGYRVGAWNEKWHWGANSIAVDKSDQLWIVDAAFYPKRVTVWSTDGAFKREHLGTTTYGNAGTLDPWDNTRVFLGPLEFAIDPKTGLSRIKNFTWDGSTPPGEVPVRVNDRTYLVTRPYGGTFMGGSSQLAIVYLYADGKQKMAAAFGNADQFAPLKDPTVLSELGNVALPQLRFMWTDRNGDGIVQAKEVTLTPRPKDMGPITLFNRDLGVQAGPFRYRVKEFLPTGVPVYEEVRTSAKGEFVQRFEDGSYFRMGSNKDAVAGMSADGAVTWTYPQEGAFGDALHGAKPWRTDQVVSELGILGMANSPGDLGEFTVVHTNAGGWNIWTKDGLLAGPIFHDYRSPAVRPWSMKEHARGMMLPNLSLGEEHFNGYFCRSEVDGKFYAIAGHNHLSIVEVQGLEKFKRITGTITVTSDDLKKAQEWDARRQSADLFTRAPVLDVYRLKKAPDFDGKLSGWGPADATMPEGAQLRVGYDDRNLYLGWMLRDLGPLANSGRDWDRLFKTGAALDVHLATDPNADPNRKAAVAGDIRLLLTYRGKEPVAVIYRAVVPGIAADRKWRVVSPVGEAVFDEVKTLTNVRMVRGQTDRGEIIVEASVPLAELGLKPMDGVRVKFDWGVLVAGPDGTEVLRRIYWANKGALVTADTPSEARLNPHQWGHARFHGLRVGVEEKFGGPDDLTKPKADKKDINDILDDLKPPTGKKP
ncbi:NHL repeat-containing protein [Zavarzinella formosa]|uniref:hypothetical protein n=1 Tax=Zavarzinella formosa TaxID=360055 RepID=UPI0002D66644|nr:hypothetical protein [Zavarzinella formosa]